MAYKQPDSQAYASYSDYSADHYDSSSSYPNPGIADFGTGRGHEKYQPGVSAPPTFRGNGSKWNPKFWSKRTRVIVGVATAVVLIVVIVVAAVEGVKDNAYPNYSPLNYTLDTSIQPDDFFSNFGYWDTYDPAQGFVHYDNPTDAANRNLTYSSSSSAFLRVDDQETNQTTGRHSARVYSTKTWNSGLFLFDIQHSPYGCATWPAVWLSDQSNWPNNGEIDVIEAVNQATTGVQSTLHTTNGCEMKVKREQTGSVVGTNCWNGTDDNAGCGVTGPASTYGEAFNNAGGGVYAAEWRSAGIRIWFFPRASLPTDVSAAIGSQSNSSVPNPSTWGEALADFPSTDCNIGSHFRNASIIANIDLCGQWAGSVYNSPDNCPGSCDSYVANNPQAFTTAYWQFGAFMVYHAEGEA